MRNWVLRLAITCSAAFLTATILNFIIHAKSWKSTHLAVQPLELNQPNYTLKTYFYKIALDDQPEALQKTLNSSYKKFGLIVTDCRSETKDCPDQQILSTSVPIWAGKNDLKGLQNRPYELLRKPVSSAEAQDDFKAHSIGKSRLGEIIGRAYYVRSDSPSFLKEYISWGFNPFDIKENRLIYTLTVAFFLVGGLIVWVVWELVIHKQHLYKKLAEQREQRLNGNIQVLVEQLNEQLIQSDYLVNQLGAAHGQAERTQQEVDQLQNQLYTARQNALRSQQEVNQLQNQLTQAETQAERDEHNISQLRNQLEEAKRQVQDKQQTITQLRDSLGQHQIDQQNNRQLIHQLQDQLLAEQFLQQELEQYQLREAQAKVQVENLRNKLTAKERKEADYIELLEQEDKKLDQELKQSQQEVAGYKTQIDALEAEKSNLIEQLRQTNRKLEHQQRGLLTDAELKVKTAESRKRYTIWIENLKDLEHLQERIFGQVMTKILSLQNEPRPHDSRLLNHYGYRDVYRVKTGEYRICYSIHHCPEKSAGEVRILMVGKRNDKEIYEELMRRLK